MADLANAVSGVAPARGRWHLSRQARRNIVGWLWISPWLVGFVVFTAGGMLFSLVLAFMRWDILSPMRWVGLANFSHMFSDEYFYIGIMNSAYYTLIGVPLFTFSAIGLAILLNRRLPGVNLFRTTLYLPQLTPTVALTVLWLYMFNADFGLINVFLQNVGLPAVPWMVDPSLAKPALIIMGLWFTGARSVIYIAALQGVPDQLYEAARLDGAGRLALLRHVTLPMISPIIFFGLITGFIGSFQVFEIALLIVSQGGHAGGPAYATYFYVLHLYHVGWESLQMGYAAALAWVLFLVILVLTIVQLWLARRWVYYESEGR